MWRPITDADTSRRAWAVIEEIERGLAGDVTPIVPPELNLADPMLSGGRIGLALFFAYLEAARPGCGGAERALDILDTAIGAVADVDLEPSLYSGFCGVGWVTGHLARQLFEGGDDLTAEIDAALRSFLANRRSIKPYELVRGVCGFGTYLLERLPHPDARELLVRVLDHLEATAEESAAGCTWWTIPAWIPEPRRAVYPHGCYNLGIAHGIPGVLGFLAAAQRAGVDDPRIPRFAEGTVRWLLARRLAPGATSAFPPFYVPGEEPEPARTGWCYGDLGIAAVLLSAGRSFERPDWEREALGLAHLAARRTPEDGRVVDACLCHGAAGLSHMFLRMYQATGDALLEQAALAWLERALAMRRPGEGIAGYLSWVTDGGLGQAWRADPSFLNGAAGVGLALLAAVSEVEPAWDRVMLLSTPPRAANGGSRAR